MSAISKTIISNLRLQRCRITCFATQKRHMSAQDDFMKSPFPDLELPKINVVEFVTKDFGPWHNKIATVCGITGRKYTFDDIRIKSHNLAKALREIFKLQKGDVVAFVLPNVPEYPICIMGCLSAGITITPVNPTYTPNDIQRQFLDCNVKAVFTMGPLIPTIKSAIFGIKHKIPIIAIKSEQNESFPEGTVVLQELFDVNLVVPNLDPTLSDDIAVIPYSSGTTGLPKGVELTNDNILANVAQFNYDGDPERADDIVPCILPMFHIYGLTLQCLGLLQTGVRLVTLPKFTPELYLNTIIQHKATALVVAPPVVLFLTAHPSVKPEHLKTLRRVVCGAAPLSGADEAKLIQKVGRRIGILQGYGLTETSPLVLTVPDGKQKDGGMGYITNNTLVKVVAVDGTNLQHLGPNQIGELLIKGPQVMKGYHNRPNETEAAFTDGWFRSGDLVRYDEDEMFYIADRIKELIKVKGYQVPPAELEEIIRKYPGVAESAVIGVPHERYGEAPRAYVVPKQGCNIDVNKLAEFVKSQVTSYKQLTGGVTLIDAIPKNPSGKFLRRELKNLYVEKGV